MQAIIIAGGKGTRLMPYTTIFPKPLMPIKHKPILEIVIQQLKSHGLNEITINVGHLAELITAFFGDGSKFGVKIRYLREDRPLGTVGALGFCKNALNESFLMMNGDVLTTLNYSDLINYHHRSGAIATIALNKRSTQIDFGVAEVQDDNTIVKYVEKPKVEHLVSMGIYVFEPAVLGYIKPSEYLDFPNLVNKLIADGENVKGFVFDGYWLDIGRPEDYQKANDDIDEMTDKLGIK